MMQKFALLLVLALGLCGRAWGSRATGTPTVTPTHTPVFSPSSTPTQTQTFSCSPTSTPTPTTVCPARVTPYSGNPILSASATWEAGEVSEPSVIQDGARSFRMIYTGGYGSCLGLATSKDGLSWEKYRGGADPVIGKGFGGEGGGAVGGELVRYGRKYRCYYRNGSQDICLALSSDGASFSCLTRAAVAHDCIPGVKGWYNSSVYKDPSSAKTWWMILDANTGAYPQWQDYLFKSTDGGLTFSHVQPLPSMQVSGIGVWGSPSLFYRRGQYHVYYLISQRKQNSPSVLWHASSPDLRNWFPDPAQTLGIPGNEMGLAKPDQVADPCAIEWGRKSYVYFDAVDNGAQTGKIGVAIFDGTLDQLVNCRTTRRGAP